jgi:hypothetical protein
MRPEVRIIQDQQEEIKPADISQNERDMLLAKYGYKPQTTYVEPTIPQDSGMSFEEMCRREEERLYNERMRRHQERMGPKPITFDGNYYSNEEYGTEADSGFTFKVSVVSDMPIPKRY